MFQSSRKIKLSILGVSLFAVGMAGIFVGKDIWLPLIAVGGVSAVTGFAILIWAAYFTK